jgi:sulfatase modifying factor 1
MRAHTITTVLVTALLFASIGINGSTAGTSVDIINCYPVAGGFVLEWVPAGSDAVVKWTPDLTTPFTDLSAKLPSTQSSYTDTVHGTDNQCFYRVELDAPGGMVLIPGGTNSGTDPDFGVYSITISAFYMDVTEITKAQWDTVYNWAMAHDYQFDNAGSGKASNHPVQTVNWDDCLKWCNARSQMENKIPCYTVGGSTYKTGQSDPNCNFNANGYRLPTSDEWEYAARGGYSSRRFPWGNTITHSQANYYSSSSYSYDVSSTRGFHPSYVSGGYPYTSPVGSFSSNGYGLYDMSGNVWEWCWDASGSGRSLWGGSWYYYASSARCGFELWDPPGGVYDSFGFRAVCR